VAAPADERVHDLGQVDRRNRYRAAPQDLIDERTSWLVDESGYQGGCVENAQGFRM
jgi:hypothetical protein